MAKQERYALVEHCSTKKQIAFLALCFFAGYSILLLLTKLFVPDLAIEKSTQGFAVFVFGLTLYFFFVQEKPWDKGGGLEEICPICYRDFVKGGICPVCCRSWEAGVELMAISPSTAADDLIRSVDGCRPPNK